MITAIPAYGRLMVRTAPYLREVGTCDDEAARWRHIFNPLVFRKV